MIRVTNAGGHADRNMGRAVKSTLGDHPRPWLRQFRNKDESIVPQIKGVVNTDTCLTALTQNCHICYFVHGVYSPIERHSAQSANSFSRPLLPSCSLHVHE
jgi:hypothetical protein